MLFEPGPMRWSAFFCVSAFAAVACLREDGLNDVIVRSVEKPMTGECSPVNSLFFT